MPKCSKLHVCQNVVNFTVRKGIEKYSVIFVEKPF